MELSHNALDGRGGQHLGNILRYNNVRWKRNNYFWFDSVFNIFILVTERIEFYEQWHSSQWNEICSWWISRKYCKKYFLKFISSKNYVLQTLVNLHLGYNNFDTHGTSCIINALHKNHVDRILLYSFTLYSIIFYII